MRICLLVCFFLLFGCCGMWDVRTASAGAAIPSTSVSASIQVNDFATVDIDGTLFVGIVTEAENDGVVGLSLINGGEERNIHVGKETIVGHAATTSTGKQRRIPPDQCVLLVPLPCTMKQLRIWLIMAANI